MPFVDSGRKVRRRTVLEYLRSVPAALTSLHIPISDGKGGGEGVIHLGRMLPDLLTNNLDGDIWLGNSTPAAPTRHQVISIFAGLGP